MRQDGLVLAAGRVRSNRKWEKKYIYMTKRGTPTPKPWQRERQSFSPSNHSKAVSYEEYFRQIFGLSGSKKIVENIPRKYCLGNMGSVLGPILSG